MRTSLPLLVVALITALSAWLLLRTERPSAMVDPPVQPSPSLPQVRDVADVAARVAVPVPAQPEEPLLTAPLAEPTPAPARLGLNSFGRPVSPEDPVVGGAASLDLFLRDAASHEPVASTIRLWGLDAPGNEHWTRGDQLQAVVWVPVAGLSIGELAEGRYRVVVLKEGDQHEDPRSFVVGPGRNRIVLDVQPARALPAFAVLVDQDGRRIESAQMKRAGAGDTSCVVNSPSWVIARERRIPRESGGEVTIGGSAGSYSASFRKVTAGPDGFALGASRENSREQALSQRFRFRKEGFAEAEVVVHGGHHDQRTYLSVLIDPLPVLQRIHLPEGGTAEQCPQRVTILAGSIRQCDARNDTPWLDIPIRVQLSPSANTDYQPFAFTFTLREGPPAPMVLRPLAAQPAGG